MNNNTTHTWHKILLKVAENKSSIEGLNKEKMKVKNFYERREYDTVADTSLSKTIYRKTSQILSPDAKE